MLRALYVLLPAMIWLATAQAAIDSVTVFPDRATVTRIVETNVAAGKGELVEADLPEGLSRDSLRISASGPERLRLGGYQIETVRGSERVSARARKLEAQLETLRARRDVIDDGIEAREMQLSLLQSLAGGTGQGEDQLTVEAWERALGTIGEGAEEVLAARRQLRLDRREVEKEIDRLERELSDLGQNQRDTLKLRLAYASKSAGRARFAIEYTIRSAAWRPVYEWRLDTESGRLAIEQFAEVRQRTGEDWSDVELSLSLARPAAGGGLPEIRPWWVDVAEPRPEARRRVQEKAVGRDMVVSAARAPARAAEAELVGTSYTQRYDVAGRAEVAADNHAHRFRLAGHTLDVRLSARTVPRRRATAWLYAEGEFGGDAALPPGSVTLYQDNTLVGQTNFAGLIPGDELASSFGVDNRIDVDFRLIDDERATEGMLRKSTRLKRVHRVVVRNGHDRSIDLTVLDAMPVSRDERIEVSLTDNASAPDERNVDDRRGVLAWHRELGAGASIELTLGYQLTFPEGLERIQGW